MRFLLLALALPVSVAGAVAQDGPKHVKTETIRTAPPGQDVLFAIDADGTVRIDWSVVETLARTKADRNLSPLAEVMLAIRDETWKPAR
jgi:hypothetical protein